MRAGLAIGMSAMLTPVAMPHAAPMPTDLINQIIALACEVLLGIVIGSVVLMAVSALQLAGQSIGHLAGLMSRKPLIHRRMKTCRFWRA